MSEIKTVFVESRRKLRLAVVREVLASAAGGPDDAEIEFIAPDGNPVSVASVVVTWERETYEVVRP